jgi:peroxiredoxin
MESMNRLLILILFVSLAPPVSAQNGFGDCILKSLINVDSTVGDTIFNSLKWQDCVMDKPVPDIKFTTITGKNVELKKLQGKVVVFNFWFSACQPCIEEIPALNRLVKEYKNKGVEFFGITYDSYNTVKKFLPKYKFDFNIVCDVKNLTEAFSAGYPTTYIIDQKGIVRMVWSGGFIGEEAKTAAYLKAKPMIDGLLSEK